MTESKRMHTFALGESNVDKIQFKRRGDESGSDIDRCLVDLAGASFVGKRSMWVKIVTKHGDVLDLRTAQDEAGDYSNADDLWSDVSRLVGS